MIAVGVLVLWAAGLGLLTRREFFRPRLERLAEAGLRVNQFTSFYGLRDNGRLVGYASSVVDTTPTEITVTEMMIRETSIRRRWSKRAKITLSRTFRLKEFESAIETNTVDLKTTGKVEGDSLVFSLSSNDKPPTVSTIKLDGPVLLPNLVPLAIALTKELEVGRKYIFPVFDPSTNKIVQVNSTVQKETTFVIADSAVFDSTSLMWKPYRDVEVRGWLIASSPGGFNGWLDDMGHVVRTTGLDADVMLSTIEEAFENWLIGVNRRRRAAGLLPPLPDADAPRPPNRP